MQTSQLSDLNDIMAKGTVDNTELNEGINNSILTMILDRELYDNKSLEVVKPPNIRNELSFILRYSYTTEGIAFAKKFIIQIEFQPAFYSEFVLVSFEYFTHGFGFSNPEVKTPDNTDIFSSTGHPFDQTEKEIGAMIIYDKLGIKYALYFVISVLNVNIEPIPAIVFYYTITGYQTTLAI